MDKAKQILLNEARKIRAKANQKQREAERLFAQATEIEAKAKEMQ